MGSIRRLKETWKILPTKTLEILLELEDLTKTDDNWRTYRDQLKAVKWEGFVGIPVFPYLGLLAFTLTD